MKSKTRYSFQELKKLRFRQCFFCGLDDYSLLDCHRIVPGELNGHYTPKNTLVTCANCHRRIHAGQIVIHGKYYSTAARYMVNYTENDQEHWRLE
jgi:hypothetical protein